MFYKQNIKDLKADMQDMIGQKILVKKREKRKFFEKEAYITNTYDNYITFQYVEKKGSIQSTCSYKDILTDDTEIQVFNGETYSPLMPINKELKMHA